MKVEKQAPMGKFRVVGVDTFANEDWIQGDFDTLQEAIDTADAKGGNMCKMYVYDDKSGFRHEAGTF